MGRQVTKVRFRVHCRMTTRRGVSLLAGVHCFRAQQEAAAARVSLQRQVTAPSVPARSQVFGYEEDSAGRLVMQPPPNQGHTGVGSDRPGPLDYEPDKLKVMKGSTATGWAKSKAERRTAPGTNAQV